MKICVYSIILLALLFSYGNTQTEELPVSNIESARQQESDVHQGISSEDTLIQSDSSSLSIDEEQADQIRIFVNTTLIIIIIAILILALTVFLIVNRVRRTRAE